MKVPLPLAKMNAATASCGTALGRVARIAGLIATLTGVATLFEGPTLAQMKAMPVHPAPGMLVPSDGVPPKTVAEGFARAGLHEMRNLRQRGPNFTAEGLTMTGQQARVVIHGTTGAVLGFRVLDASGAHETTGNIASPNK